MILGTVLRSELKDNEMSLNYSRGKSETLKEAQAGTAWYFLPRWNTGPRTDPHLLRLAPRESSWSQEEVAR